jgi:hypothetical protein
LLAELGAGVLANVARVHAPCLVALHREAQERPESFTERWVSKRTLLDRNVILWHATLAGDGSLVELWVTA